MAAINFPDSPSNGDTHVVGGVTYTYNSTETKWKTTINSNAFLPLSGGTVSGNIVLDGELQHSGDTDTKLHFDTDTIKLDTAGSERFRVGSAGQLGIGGATYGSSGQVLTSQGASAAPQWTTLTTGTVLQVQSSIKTSAENQSIPSSVHTDITGLSVDLTPSNANNIIYVSYSVTGENHSGVAPWNIVGSFSTTIGGTRTVRGPTGVSNQPGGIIHWVDSHGSGNDSSSTMGALHMVNYPFTAGTTDTITFRPTIRFNAAASFGINRTATDSNGTDYERTHSWITVMEVAA